MSKHIKNNVQASIVVFFLLPYLLGLGIALASDGSLSSGIIAGLIVGMYNISNGLVTFS